MSPHAALAAMEPPVPVAAEPGSAGPRIAGAPAAGWPPPKRLRAAPVEGACPNRCRGGQPAASGREDGSCSCPVAWRPLPRLLAAPDYEAYLRDYALPRRPFILERDAVLAWGWPAADGRWRDLAYLVEHPQVLAMERLFDRPEGFRPVALSVAVRQASAQGSEPAWRPCGVSSPMTPRAALQKLRAREELGAWGDDGISMYLRAWEYDSDEWATECPPGGHGLADDVGPGVPFARCVLSEELGAQHPFSRSIRWIYIGEPGSGSLPHVDPLATHAWMWQAKGRKEWRIVRRDPAADALPVCGAPGKRPSPAGAAEGGAAEGDEEEVFQVSGAPAPLGAPADLFGPEACGALAAWLAGRPSCGAWAGELREGEVLFVPSGTLHAVRNAPPGLSVAISHNYADPANALAVLRCLEQALGLLLAELDGAERPGRAAGSLEAALGALEGCLDAQNVGLLAAVLESRSLPGRLARRAAQRDRHEAAGVAARCERQLHSIALEPRGAKEVQAHA